jgi:hypothetical protein
MWLIELIVGVVELLFMAVEGIIKVSRRTIALYRESPARAAKVFLGWLAVAVGFAGILALLWHLDRPRERRSVGDGPSIGQGERRV